MENLSSPNPTPEPVSGPVSAPVPTQQYNRKWLTPLFSVLVLLLLASTGYLSYQNQQLKKMLVNYQHQSTLTPSTTSDPTANWKTYTNQKNGFSFQFPSQWESCPTTGTTAWLIDPGKCQPPYSDYHLQISVTDSTQKIDDYGAPGDSSAYTASGKKELQLGLYKFIKQSFIQTKPYSWNGETIQAGTIVLFYDLIDVKNNRVIEFYTIGANVDEKQIDQILSTFKFLDSSSNKIYSGKNFSIDTSIWKLLSDANQSPATPEVLETVAFENSQARMNIQVGTDAFEKVLTSQDGEVVGNVVIDGATATKKSGYGGIAGSVYSVNLVLAHQGKTYIIGFYTQDSKNIGDYEKKFNEAVSTFKFTQ